MKKKGTERRIKNEDETTKQIAQYFLQKYKEMGINPIPVKSLRARKVLR
jgi:hypothetical protein